MPSQTEAKEIVIRPPGRFTSVDVWELYRYRSLLKSMVVRQIKIEFDQMYLSYFWAVARPLLMVVVFALFRHLSEARTGVTIPYPLYLLSGLILWFYLVEGVMDTSTAVRRDLHLMRKVFYPKLLSPMATNLSNLYKLVIAGIPLVLMMFYYGVSPGWQIVLLAPVVLQLALLVFGIGLMFVALNLSNQDWGKFLGLVLYLGLFLSPVIYAPEMIPEEARDVYALNPMVGALLGFRSALFADLPFPWPEWFYSLMFSLSMAVIGLMMFQSAEKRFVDEM